MKVRDDDGPVAAYTRGVDGRLTLLNIRMSWLAGSSTEQDDWNAMDRETRAHKRHLQLVMSDSEHARIEERARVAGLSISAYLRTAGLCHPIRSVLDYDAVRDLARLNGDQGRLAGLLKLWLEDRPGRGAPEIEVRRLVERIGRLQERLIDVVSRV